MRARAVVGSGFGDCGKGSVTDYLCSTQGAGVVVRYCGGANAGHTVVTPDGLRHVFSHFGSGTFCGVPTFLSQFFITNPLLFFTELDKLALLDIKPAVYAHPNCLVTTFADMIINQRREDARGATRHGSCGIGFNETWERSQMPMLKITMADLWNGVSLRSRLQELCGKYASFRTGKPIEDADRMIEEFEKVCARFAEAITPSGIAQCRDPVFEGSQGLLLDQDNKQFFPHVTRSKTGMHNVRILCEQAGISEIDAYYVSRTYLTRHGAGTLPGEDPKLSYPDDTNVPNPYQGTLRFAPLDVTSLLERIRADGASTNIKLVLTHCDQLPAPKIGATLESWGPTRAHVEHCAAPLALS